MEIFYFIRGAELALPEHDAMNYSELLHPSTSTCSYVDPYPDQMRPIPTLEHALLEEELDSLMLACSQQYENQQEHKESDTTLSGHGLMHLLKALIPSHTKVMFAAPKSESDIAKAIKTWRQM